MNDLTKWLPSLKTKQPEQQQPPKITKQRVFDNILDSKELCEHCKTAKAIQVIDDIKLCLQCFEKYQYSRKEGITLRWEWLNEYNRRKKDEKTNS